MHFFTQNALDASPTPETRLKQPDWFRQFVSVHLKFQKLDRSVQTATLWATAPWTLNPPCFNPDLSPGRGCVLLDQSQRQQLVEVLRLAFDTTALRPISCSN